MSVRLARLFAILALSALVAAGCGAQLENDKKTGSNFNADDFKKTEKTVVPVTQPIGSMNKPHEVRDPDGLLYRIDQVFHDHLAEVRLDDDDGLILLIFRGSDAIKLRSEDIESMRLITIEDGKLVIRVREQEFRLRQHEG